MHLALPRQHGLHQRDAERAAQIARDVHQRAGLIVLARAYADIGDIGDGDEQERQRHRLDHAGDRRVAERHVGVESRHVPQRDRLHRQGKADQKPRVDPGGQKAGQRHHQKRRKPAGRQRQASIGGGIAQHFLQQLGNELGGAEDDQAHQQHEDVGDDEIAVAEQLDVDDGLVLRQLPGNEGQKTERAYRRGGADQARWRTSRHAGHGPA